MSFYTEMEQFSYEMIEEFGQDITLHHKIDQCNPTDTKDVTYTILDITMKGVVADYSLEQIGGTLILQDEVDLEYLGGPLILQGDKELIISSRGGTPSVSDEVTVGATIYSVRNVNEINPGGTSLIYKLQIRTLRRADAKFVKLAYLTPGDRVKDPKSNRLWRVAAQHHFGTYLTLLVSDKLLSDPMSFNEPHGIVTWSGSDVRAYLRSSFYQGLTDNFRGIIEECTTVTASGSSADNPDVYGETVFMLSATELGYDGWAVSSDDGTHIPYFSGKGRRSAVTETVPKTYWTRTPKNTGNNLGICVDVGGDFVDSLGGETIYADTAGIRVRPAVNLNGLIYVVQNAQGIWELQFAETMGIY